MAKSRSKSASTRKKKSSAKGRPKSRARSTGTSSTNTRSRASEAPARPTLRSGEVLDDIELLNVHRYPESMPQAVISFVRNDKACQRRLEELVKGTPGKRGQSGFNQLFQQKLDESEKQAPPPPPQGSADGSSAPAPSRASASQPEPAGGVGGFFRKLFS